jgi:hypothetical protein
VKADRLRDPFEAIDWIFQIERFVARIEHACGPRREILLPEEIQDIIKLNIQHAIEAGSDLAIHILHDQRYDDPRKRFPQVGRWRHLYFGILAENNVIEPAAAECMADMVRWLYIAENEYWHVRAPDVDGKQLQTWLATLQELIGAVVERFDLVCPEDWDDSSGRNNTERGYSVVPTARSGDGQDGDHVEVEG